MELELDDDRPEPQRVVRDVVGRECPPEPVRAMAGDLLLGAAAEHRAIVGRTARADVPR